MPPYGQSIQYLAQVSNSEIKKLEDLHLELMQEATKDFSHLAQQIWFQSITSYLLYTAVIIHSVIILHK